MAVFSQSQKLQWPQVFPYTAGSRQEVPETPSLCSVSLLVQLTEFRRIFSESRAGITELSQQTEAQLSCPLGITFFQESPYILLWAPWTPLVLYRHWLIRLLAINRSAPLLSLEVKDVCWKALTIYCTLLFLLTSPHPRVIQELPAITQFSSIQKTLLGWIQGF